METNKLTYEQAKDLLQARAMANLDYIENGDNSSNYDFLPKEENFCNAIIWDSKSKGDSLYNHEHGCHDFTIENLMKKYDFSDASDLFAYIFDNCDLQAEYTGNQYYRCGTSQIEFAFYGIDENEDQIQSCDNSGLYEFLINATDEQITNLTKDTYFGCIDFQYHDGKKILVDMVQYIGGAYTFFCGLQEAIEILENK